METNERSSSNGTTNEKSSRRVKQSTTLLVRIAIVVCLVGVLLSSFARRRALRGRADAIDVCLDLAPLGGTYIVTGGSSGIGLETVRALWTCGADVVIVATRNEEKARAAIESIRREGRADGRMLFERLDLSSIRSADAFVNRVSTKKYPPLRALILNGGIFSPRFGRTRDGTERTFQVNYLTHHELTTRLLSTDWVTNKTNTPVRVVAVSSSSVAVSTGRILPYDDPTAYPVLGFAAYADSKAAMFRFARELSRRYDPHDVIAMTVHPGLIATDLGLSRTRTSTFERLGARLFWASLGPLVKTARQGAATQTYCATSRDVLKNVSRFNGAWLQDREVWEPNGPDVDARGENATETDRAQWELSETIIQRILRTNPETNLETKEEEEDASWFDSLTTTMWSSTLSSPDRPWSILAIHVLSYVAFFGIANLLFGPRRTDERTCRYRFGLRKIVPRFANAKLMSRERRRTMYSAAIDAAYHVLFLRLGVVGPDVGPADVNLVRVGLIIAFWGTTHFYFTHRLLHTPWLYANVHVSHHESTNPGPWSSTSFHPIEGLIFYSQYLIVPLGVSLPWHVWLAFKCGVVVGTLNGHLGYDLGWWTGPVHHYHHHHLKNCNYGGVPFGFWDRVMGTSYEARASGEEEDRSVVASDVLVLLGVVPAFALCRVISWMCGVHLAAIMIVVALTMWLLLVDGAIYALPRVFPRRPEDKVFVVGLSRTGTTSLSAALNRLGRRCYHFNRHIVNASDATRLARDRTAIEAFDGHTDIATVPALEQLASAYPLASFVLSLRDERQWASAMVRFMRKNRTLFEWHPVPRRFYGEVYGERWAEYEEKDWIRVWRDHVRRVRRLFSDGPRRRGRLLEMNVGELAKRGEAWSTLCAFLGIEDVPREPFPHRLVFWHSFVTQPWEQVRALTRRALDAALVLVAFVCCCVGAGVVVVV